MRVQSEAVRIQKFGQLQLAQTSQIHEHQWLNIPQHVVLQMPMQCVSDQRLNHTL